jgi:predicted metalloprotease with PDZ domain
MNRKRCCLFFVVLALLVAVPVGAQPLEPIRYTLSFSAPQTHYVEIDAVIPTDGQPQVDLMMAVWTPGSYLVREFERHVEAVTALGAGGARLPLEKTRKNRWRITTNGARTVSLRYRVYCREMSVRTNWVDDQFALINGAPTFITLVDQRARAHEVRLQLPAGWSRSLSGMPAASPEPNHYRAADYDTLVDSPIVAGNPAVYDFTVQGKPHHLVNIGEVGLWDGARAAQDLAKVVQKTADLWANLPYDRYLFFNIIGAPANGIEHKNSTVLNTDRMSTRTRGAYLGWLGLASHEYFHTWNVKRLRPIELGPFDYENEVYTKGLWFAEGVTDYYGDLQVHRAGLSTREEYLSDLSNQISGLQTTPGRLVQPVETASYDAWIEYYRPDENSVNTSISYYVKGAVIGFLLDARIRRATDGARSLDDLMRLMYQRHSGARGFTPQDLRAAALEVAGPAARDDLQRWLARALETTDELEYSEALDLLGLRFRPASDNRRAWLGLNTRVDNGRTIVTQIRRGTPAFEAGFNVDDEIVAIDDIRVPAGQLDTRIGQFQPGNKVSVLITRRDLERRLNVTLGTEPPQPPQPWSLEIKQDGSAQQRTRLEAWLGK